MSRENVEVVRRLFDAAARRDTATVFSLYDPDFVWDGSRHRWAEVMGGETRFRGHEGLRRWFRDYHAIWEDQKDHVEALIDAGEQVISITTIKARGRASGVEVEWKHNVAVWTLREGKIVRVVFFPTRAEALEAVGLSE